MVFLGPYHPHSRAPSPAPPSPQTCAALRQKQAEALAEFLAGNQRFDAEHLKGTEAGGKYAPESIEAYRRKLGLLAMRAEASKERQDKLAAEVEVRAEGRQQQGERAKRD